jgi:hypothetical protein
MNIYRQTIILFGIILPVVATAAVVGLGFLLKSKMEESFNGKVASFKTYELGRQAELEIETEVTRRRPDMDRWYSQLSQETKSSVNKNIREITDKLPSKEITITAIDPSNTKAGFGSISAQASSQVRISFRGTFRTMQRTFLELETRMPQLQLQELRIDPNAGQSSSLLNFQANYTAWEN